jgi:hypothetical protein
MKINHQKSDSKTNIYDVIFYLAKNALYAIFCGFERNANNNIIRNWPLNHSGEFVFLLLLYIQWIKWSEENPHIVIQTKEIPKVNKQ